MWLCVSCFSAALAFSLFGIERDRQKFAQRPLHSLPCETYGSWTVMIGVCMMIVVSGKQHGVITHNSDEMVSAVECQHMMLTTVDTVLIGMVEASRQTRSLNFLSVLTAASFGCMCSEVVAAVAEDL